MRSQIFPLLQDVQDQDLPLGLPVAVCLAAVELRHLPSNAQRVTPLGLGSEHGEVWSGRVVPGVTEARGEAGGGESRMAEGLKVAEADPEVAPTPIETVKWLSVNGVGTAWRAYETP